MSEEVLEKYKNAIIQLKKDGVAEMNYTEQGEQIRFIFGTNDETYDGNYEVNDIDNIEELDKFNFYSQTDMVLRALTILCGNLGFIAYAYDSKKLLYFYNNTWYKYAGNANINQIQHNLSNTITNLELFRFIKRTLIANEKTRLYYYILYGIKRFEEQHNVEKTEQYILNNITAFKSAMITYSKMTIDSSEYISIKALLERVFTVENSKNT